MPFITVAFYILRKNDTKYKEADYIYFLCKTLAFFIQLSFFFFFFILGDGGERMLPTFLLRVVKGS